jgi:uncharacterized Tic20 family protein
MSYMNLGEPDVGASRFAQFGVVVGAAVAYLGVLFDFWPLLVGLVLAPLIPFLVWTSRRNEEPVSARDAGAAANFGMFVFLAFTAAIAVRAFVPWFGFVGALLQAGLLVVAAVLCVQAAGSVGRGVPAQYPIGAPLIRYE